MKLTVAKVVVAANDFSTEIQKKLKEEIDVRGRDKNIFENLLKIHYQWLVFQFD